MDRKYCVLLYSNYSQASIDLLEYIKGLPLEFPKVTGMTMICIDNDNFKSVLQKNGIEYVPTLLVEYYGGTTKQKFERDYIYMWIDQVMKALHFEWPQTQHDPDPIKEQGRGITNLPQTSEPPLHDGTPQISKEKVNITLLAQQMAKDRDSYISDTTPDYKKERLS
jgi:hypothetical protein